QRTRGLAPYLRPPLRRVSLRFRALPMLGSPQPTHNASERARGAHYSVVERPGIESDEIRSPARIRRCSTLSSADLHKCGFEKNFLSELPVVGQLRRLAYQEGVTASGGHMPS